MEERTLGRTRRRSDEIDEMDEVYEVDEEEKERGDFHHFKIKAAGRSSPGNEL